MNQSLFILIVCLWTLSGCAFKQPVDVPASSRRSSDSAAGRILVDWSKTPTEHLSENLKAIRSLSPRDSSVFEAVDPVTLPSELPAVVMVAAEIPEEILSSDALFVRARFDSDGKVIDLLGEFGEVIRDSGASPRVTFVLSGWSAVFPRDQASQGIVVLDLYSHQNRLFSIRFQLRTPPSHIESKLISIKEWKAQTQSSKLPLLTPEVAKKRLNLLTVLELSNSEKLPVVFSFPRRPGATFTQKAIDYNYRDTGCVGAGYAVDEVDRIESLADDILILPMDSRFLTEALNGIANPGLLDSITLRLGPGETQNLGIYGLGNSANKWMNQGPNPNALQQKQVSSDCYRECGSYSCHGHGEPKTPSFDFGVLGCSCDSWKDLRHSAQITTGTIREDATLSLPGPAIEWPLRFGDLDASRDGEARSLTLIPSSFSVSWF